MAIEEIFNTFRRKKVEKEEEKQKRKGKGRERGERKKKKTRKRNGQERRKGEEGQGEAWTGEEKARGRPRGCTQCKEGECYLSWSDFKLKVHRPFSPTRITL